MLIDALLTFIPIGAPLSCVGATGATFLSNVLDEAGTGVGQPTGNIIGTQSTFFGTDTGIGMEKPYVFATVGTAFTTSNSATLTVAFQAAPDTGPAGSYQPGTWQTLSQTPAMTAAQLTVGQDIRMDWPVAFPDNLNPRFLRLALLTPSGTSFTAGTINFAIVTNGRDDQANRFAQRNFNV